MTIFCLKVVDVNRSFSRHFNCFASFRKSRKYEFIYMYIYKLCSETASTQCVEKWQVYNCYKDIYYIVLILWLIIELKKVTSRENCTASNFQYSMHSESLALSTYITLFLDCKHTICKLIPAYSTFIVTNIVIGRKAVIFRHFFKLMANRSMAIAMFSAFYVKNLHRWPENHDFSLNSTSS